MAHVIDAIITLRDQLSGTLKNVNANLSQFQRQATFAGKNMISVGKDLEKVGGNLTKTITLPIVGLGVAAVAAATTFTHQMADIRKEVAATAGSSSQANSIMSQMSKSSLQWSEDFGQSTDSINAGLLTLVKDGYSGSVAMNVMQTSLNTARGSNEDLTTTVNTLGTSLEAYGLKTNNAAKTTQNMTHMADTFAYIANHTKASISSLGEAFSIVGPTASALKIPMQQTAAAIGELQSNGIDASTAATSLKAGLVNLTKPTKKMSAAMKEMNLAAFDSKGNMKDLPTILNSIEKNTQGWTNQQKQAAIATIFGKESLASWDVLLTKGGGNLNTLSKNANGAAGEVKKLADSMKNTASNKFKELTESVHALGVTFGEDILPSLTPVVNKLTDIAKGFSNLDDGTKKSILNFLLIAAAVGPPILIIGKLTHGIGDTIKGFTDLSKSISKAGGILKYLATPGGIVIVVMIALVAAAILVVTHWDKIKKAFTDFKQVLKDNETAIKNVAIALGVIFGPALVTLGAQAVATGATIAAGLIVSIVSSGVQAVITAGAFTGKMIVSLVSFALQAWKTVAVISLQTTLFIAQRLGIISAAEATNIITAAQWLFNAAMDANPIGVVILALAALGVAVYEVVKHWKDICTWIQNAWDKLNLFNKTPIADKNATVTTTYKDVVGPHSALTASHASTSAGPSIKAHNALGTSYYGGGETWVGENGPEIVTLPKGSQVKDHQSSVNSSGKNISIAKLADMIIVREEADIEKIANMLVLKLNITAANMA